jgi:hypothetical protein
MGSLRKVLRRKLSRKLQALKFAVKKAQQAWQALASKQVEGLSPADYHIAVGHYASLITAVVYLQQKLLCTCAQLGLESNEAIPPTCDHLIRIAAIWQNTFFVMLNKSGYVHTQCAICCQPPYRIHADLRKQLCLWDPNHSRTLRNVCRQTVANALHMNSIDIYRPDARRRVQPTVRKEITLQTMQWSARQTINYSVAVGQTDIVIDGNSESCGLIPVWLIEWGRSFGPPLWWFHRWRMRVCGRAQSLAWCRVCVVRYSHFMLCYRNGK